MGAVKELLKKILPPPVRTFLREIEGLQRLTERQAHLLAEGQDRTIKAVERQAEELARLLREQTERAEKLRRVGDALTEQVKNLHRANEGLTDRLERLEKSQRETLEKLESLRTEVEKGRETLHAQTQQAEAQRKALSAAVEQARKQSIDAARFASEAVWAETFNNTVNGSAWLKNTAFSPGRWAVGYPVLYVMYRVLNEARPQRILELGLGQSTRMIGQYAAAFPDVEHIVVEQDREWTEFFKRQNPSLTNTDIIHVPAAETEMWDDDRVLVYEELPRILKGKRFDFISVDGPAHSRSEKYRRADILQLVPQSLESSFCILMDDMNEAPCRSAYGKLLEKLDAHGVEFVRGYYYGKKTFNVTVSPDQKFLTTL